MLLGLSNLPHAHPHCTHNKDGLMDVHQKQYRARFASSVLKRQSLSLPAPKIFRKTKNKQSERMLIVNPYLLYSVSTVHF
jgi:hypothetical protein